MSITLMSYVFAMELPLVDKMVLLCLADHAHDDGSHVYPAVASLAHKASLGTTATRQALRRLESAALLIEVEPGGGRNHPTRYRLDVDALRNPTPREGFTNPTPHVDKPNASRRETPETQRLTSQTQRIGVAEPSEPSELLTVSEPLALAPRTRAADPVFEELFMVDALVPYSPENRQRLTKRELAALNAAAAEIRKTAITPQELHDAIGAWPMVFGDATVTANAVAKHLNRLRRASEGMVARAELPSEFDKTMASLARRRAEREREEEEGVVLG